jgi:hypothetical protein
MQWGGDRVDWEEEDSVGCSEGRVEAGTEGPSRLQELQTAAWEEAGVPAAVAEGRGKGGPSTGIS